MLKGLKQEGADHQRDNERVELRYGRFRRRRSSDLAGVVHAHLLFRILISCPVTDFISLAEAKRAQSPAEF